MLHQRLDLVPDLRTGTRPLGLGIAATLEVTQVLERLYRYVPDPGQARAAPRADDPSLGSGEELVHRLDLLPAVGAFEQLRAEAEMMEQMHLVITDRQPGVRLVGDAAEGLGQQAEDIVVLDSSS